ncbi:calcium release-activated calcium channel protein 1 isoform X2 [Drosophila tropicalis]|uniref:calcium release-activated calcium channel protein 1 isoform X2 n=1 Tax=Drosophila tropicalis TaxID=46794 RepID=UPI0035AB9676
MSVWTTTTNPAGLDTTRQTPSTNTNTPKTLNAVLLQRQQLNSVGGGTGGGTFNLNTSSFGTATTTQHFQHVVAAAVAAATSVATGQHHHQQHHQYQAHSNFPHNHQNCSHSSSPASSNNSGFKRSSLSNSLVQFPPPPPPSSTGQNLPKPRHHRTGSSSMSQSGEDLHSPTYLSWRKLQLSRAKLKASSKTSALLSGFAMVAMVEVQLNNDTKVPNGMLVAFAICTTMLVAVHMLALMISTCILPNIETVCNLHSISLVHESPHERLHWYIETAWAFSTLLGLILFLLEIAILCWVKFYDLSPPAAWSACIVLIPVMIIFLAFAVHFYRSLVTHKYEVTVSGIRELEMLKEQMEQDHLEHHNNTRNNGLHYGASGDIV